MSNIGFPCSESWRKRMYKKMVNPLAHGVSKHHLLKEAPESKPSDEVDPGKMQPKRRFSTKLMIEILIETKP